MFHELLLCADEDGRPTDERLEDSRDLGDSLASSIDIVQKEMKQKKRRIRDLEKQIETCKEQKKQHKREVKQLNEEIDGLNDTITLLESDKLVTFEDGKFIDEIRACCMSLVTNGNVSLRKIPEVISTVLLNLVGKVPTRLPSKSLIGSRIMLEARFIACRQVMH
jgi:gas vesicle protein